MEVSNLRRVLQLSAAACTIALLATASPAHAGTSTAYAVGSIIIPGGSAFQDDCGVVSRFGLIYDVLRAESYLATHGGIIHVDYVVSSTKLSPNRCIPTWTAAGPKVAPPTATGSPTYATSWDDGCDFRLTNAAGSPAKLVKNSQNPASSATDTAIVTNNTSAKSEVYPTYTSVSVDASITQLGYLGGPFVIPAADAGQFLGLLNGSITATDSAGNVIDFSPFRAAGACSFGSSHHVNVHRTSTAFNAEVSREFTAAPPRLALLATDNLNLSTKVFDGILEAYLSDAGLNFSGAQGCPTGGQLVASKCGGTAKLGQIYDLFDVKDLMNNLMSLTDASNNKLYTMVWAPHWESSASSNGPASTDVSVFPKLSAYLDGQTGFMGECGSISTLEGAYTNGAKDITAGLQLQTCKNDGAGGCAATTTYGIERNTSATPSNTIFKNCSDPNATSGARCAYFGFPGDPFVQPGDYLYKTDTGHVTDLMPLTSTSSIYKPGVVPLISIVSSLDKTKLASPATARAMVDSDVQTRSIKDNTVGKANIVYIGGHDLTAVPSGTQLVLETLLQLGAVAVAAPPPVTVEVARSSPIIAPLAGAPAIVQGTFESVTPAPTPAVVNLPADVTSFTFPAVTGHMRARTTASLTTVVGTNSKFDASGILFDAATGIPPVAYTGCASNFTTTCRTVFTTTQLPTAGLSLRPPRVFLKDGNAATLGALMVSGLSGAQAITLVDRVLAGIPDGSGGYVSKLGGVDHSTVAVIGTSATIGGARPTMVYFGATDGMLHAVCASVAGNCTAIGKELWAFIPRTQLPYIPLNTAKVDSSVHVQDMFGDFGNIGVKTFRTLLWFQTSQGDPTNANKAPAIIEMDITDPTNPTVVWEYTVSNPAARAILDLGNGLTLGSGIVQIGGTNSNVVFAQTNNGGTGGVGTVVDAIDADTGVRKWRFSYAYPAVHTAGDIAVPASGLPGGVVPIDKLGQGYATDLVFGDLYGNLWELDPATGTSRYTPNKPLFQYTTDYHPLGGTPTIYASGGKQYAVLVPGGFVDPNDTTWGSATQTIASVMLSTPNSDATLNQSSGIAFPADVPFTFTLPAGEKTFSQARVVGGQLFLTTDSTDVNAATFGSTTSTGHMYTLNLATGAQVGAAVVIPGGAGSIVNSGTELYAGSSGGQERLPTTSDAASTVGPSVNAGNTVKLTRTLWLRTL